MDFTHVHSVAIYPAIGIARVGNSPKEYFLSPTVPGVPAHDPNPGTAPFRDGEGRIKRQAAVFSVFALDKEGNVLFEIEPNEKVSIDWRVDVANKKASWYRFDLALDTAAAQGKYDTDGNSTPDGLPVLSQFRNREYEGEDRKQLMIEARAQRISGKNTNADGEKYHFKGNIGPKGKETEVFLGELRTDEKGRLLFLGGLGDSGSFNGKQVTTFANNEGWYDDTSDGPVDATVKLADGREFMAEGAWVLTAPPNYAVGVSAFSTGYDLLENLAASMHKGVRKEKPSFFKDLYPVFKYLSRAQWINAGISRDFGWGAAHDFENLEIVQKLKDPSEENRPFRQAIFECFRNPDFKKMEPQAWPPLYGDAVTFNINSTDPEQWFPLTRLKYDYLRQWAEGDFILDDVSIQVITPGDVAHGMTEAALEQTLGGPFHPGCEFTWPMRHALMYHSEKPFRIKRRSTPKEDFGVALSPEIALSEGGPLDGSTPGDLTKWMAVPWQTDTSSCLSAYRGYAGEYLPTFWPARVPNDVLTQEDLRTLNDPKASDNEKMEAFSPKNRKKWLRDYIYDHQGNYINGTSIQDRLKGIETFIKHWGEIGIIAQVELDDPGDLLPKEVWVETGKSYPRVSAPSTASRNLQEGRDTTYERPKWIDMNPRLLR